MRETLVSKAQSMNKMDQTWNALAVHIEGKLVAAHETCAPSKYGDVYGHDLVESVVQISANGSVPL